jgi:hypothetical protein
MTAPVLDRVDPFAVLGTDVSNSGTAHQALIDSGLAGMNITKVPVTSRNGRSVPGAYLLEDATGEPLPKMVVGDGFTVVQYEDVADTLDAVAARTGATFDRAGKLDVRAYGIGGARAFISMRLPEALRVGGPGGDLVQSYIVAFMSHGWNSNVLAPTATRVSCANQQPQIARGDDFKIVIRHTSSARARHIAAEAALVNSVQAMRQATREAEELLRVKTTNEQFRAIVERIYPLKSDAKGTVTRHQNRLEQLEIIRGGQTNTDIAGTAWGDYQAVLEYGQWYQRVKGGEDGDTNLATVRARRALTAHNLINDQLHAFDVVRETVGIS